MCISACAWSRAYPLLTPTERDAELIHTGTVVLDAFDLDGPAARRALRRRLQLQLSMGHPF